MADKELRRMSRTELIEIIYALQQHDHALREEKETLQKQLDERVLRMEQSGSIAEAALNLNHIFEDAENAAQQYIDSLQFSDVEDLVQQKCEKMIRDAQAHVQQMEGECRARIEQTEGECRAMREQTEGECRARIRQTESECRARLEQTEGESRVMREQTEGECRTRIEQAEGECQAMREQTENECRARIEQTEGECQIMREQTEAECNAMLEQTEEEIRTKKSDFVKKVRHTLDKHPVLKETLKQDYSYLRHRTRS